MIPILAAVGIATNVLGALFQAGAKAPPAAPAADGKNFDTQLAEELKKSKAPLNLNMEIQSLLAKLQSTGLSMEQQQGLGQMLMNKNVQVTDPSGNNVVGKVTDLLMVHGQPQIVIRGQPHPLSSVRAVIDGIPT